MHEVLRTLYSDHETIRGVLALFEAELVHFAGGQDPDYDVLQNGIGYCAEYLDAVHHRKEEQILNRLRERDPAAASHVVDLTGQHYELEHATRTLASAFTSIEGDAFASRFDLLSRGNELLAAYRRHLDWEEKTFFRAAERSMLPQDWETADRLWRESVDAETLRTAEERLAQLQDRSGRASA